MSKCRWTELSMFVSCLVSAWKELDLGDFASLEVLEDRDGILWGEIFIVDVGESIHALGVISDADHGCIGTSPHTLHLTKCEVSVLPEKRKSYLHKAQR